MIKLYIYQKSDGAFFYEDVGNPNGVLHDLGTDKDFTLEPLPDHENHWYWHGNKWNTQPA